MNTSLKIKSILFVGLLGGVLFFTKSLILPPYYQTSFTVALIPQKVSPKNIENAQKSSAYASHLVKEILPGNIFLEKLKTKLNFQFKKFQNQGISLPEWQDAISISQNHPSQALVIKISHKNPNLASLLAINTAKTLNENLASFTNNQELDFKLINQPQPPTPPGSFYLLGSFLKGFLLSSAFTTTLILFLGEKTLSWMFIKKPPKIKKRSVLKNKAFKKALFPPAKTAKKLGRKTKQKPAAKKTKSHPYSENNDEEIKERLNRLISGEL